MLSQMCLLCLNSKVQELLQKPRGLNYDSLFLYRKQLLATILTCSKPTHLSGLESTHPFLSFGSMLLPLRGLSGILGLENNQLCPVYLYPVNHSFPDLG